MQRKLLSVFKRSFEAEYITVLREKHIYNKPRILQDDSVITDNVVLIKIDSISRMKWHKGKIIQLICGNHGKVKRNKLKVYQRRLKKTVVINPHLQLVVPFEIVNETPEPTEMKELSNQRCDVCQNCRYYLSNDCKLNSKGIV